MHDSCVSLAFDIDRTGGARERGLTHPHTDAHAHAHVRVACTHEAYMCASCCGRLRLCPVRGVGRVSYADVLPQNRRGNLACKREATPIKTILSTPRVARMVTA